MAKGFPLAIFFCYFYMMKNKKINIYLLFIIVCSMTDVTYAEPSSCTYQTYKWNVKLKRAVERKTVQHSYSRLSKDEIDTITGCTVCEEDQVKINLPGLKSFAVCKLLANDIQQTLLDLIEQGEFITDVTGYRVGKTRGKIDKAYNRTQFSNHSYGIALDINSQQNGLYDRCIKFSENCRLIRGGPWKPGYKGSMTSEGSIVRRMNQLGLMWGGLIAGKQKDFMHFSPSGY